MNKIILPLSLVVLLVGCGPAPSPPKVSPAKVTTAVPPPPPTAPHSSHSVVAPPNPLPAPKPGSVKMNVPTPAPAHTALPGTLATLVRLHKVTVEKTFATAAPAITGYLVKQSGRYSILYGSGSYLIAGALIGPTGKNFTAAYKNQYAPKPDYAGLVKQINTDKTVFTLGTKGPLLYAFEDPNCIFCHKLDVATAPLIAAGKLRVRVVMVAFLKSDSPARAAAILTAKSPAKAMAKNEAGYDTAKEEGGYPVGPQPGPDMMDVLKRHLNWMQHAGSSGTPTLIYKTADGQWTARAGDPGPAWLSNYAATGHG